MLARYSDRKVSHSETLPAGSAVRAERALRGEEVANGPTWIHPPLVARRSGYASLGSGRGRQVRSATWASSIATRLGRSGARIATPVTAWGEPGECLPSPRGPAAPEPAEEPAASRARLAATRVAKLNRRPIRTDPW